MPFTMTPLLTARLTELSQLFLRLGITAFGGPAAHIALMHDETVKRRQWLSDQDFLDLLGATNLIPGPNSTEMAIHLGYLRAGWLGLIVSGVCFILPAAIIVLGLSWLYVQYGTLPQAAGILYGIKPVAIAIILQALWNLGKKAVKSFFLAGVGLVLLILAWAGVNEIGLLFGGGLFVMIAFNAGRIKTHFLGSLLIPTGVGLPLIASVGLPTTPFSLPLLFLIFLKIGAVLYGSGYVLLAFLRADLVVRYGWLSDQQLIDAIAIGQITPGPVFTTATFIGYLLSGVPGAVLATLGIFLPSFIFVAISNPFIPRLRNSRWFSPFLDGVNVASLALMATVTFELGKDALINPLTIAIALGSLILLTRYKVNSVWLIAGGAMLGWLTVIVH